MKNTCENKHCEQKVKLLVKPRGSQLRLCKGCAKHFREHGVIRVGRKCLDCEEVLPATTRFKLCESCREDARCVAVYSSTGKRCDYNKVPGNRFCHPHRKQNREGQVFSEPIVMVRRVGEEFCLIHPESKNIEKAAGLRYCRVCELESYRARVYGLSPEDFTKMFESQSGCCAICKNELRDDLSKSINIDHCHATGKVRGILCTTCNTMIGQAKDSVAVLESAIDYLKEHIDERRPELL